MVGDGLKVGLAGGRAGEVGLEPGGGGEALRVLDSPDSPTRERQQV